MISVHILALDTTRKGGAGVYTANLAKQLVASGHHVSVICHEATEDVKSICTVHELPRPPKNRPLGTWRLGAILQLSDYKRMLGELKLQKADITVGSAQPMILPYMRLFPEAKLIYIPHSMIAPVELATYEYGDIIQRLVMIKAYHFMEKKSLSLAAVTVRFTRAAADAFRKFYGEKACKNMLVLPMPLEMPKESEAHVKQKEFSLLFVGRLIESKNVAFLLKILSERINVKWHLNIVGDGPLLHPLKEMARNLGIAERVIFHGHRDDVSEYYKDADLFLFPSLLESYAIVIVEAMSYSVPVVAFRADGHRFINVTEEIISNGVDGLLATDEVEFASLLDQCISRTLPLGQIGRAARESVVEKCSWTKHMQSITALAQRIDLSNNI